MGGYIGTKSVTLSTTTASVGGDSTVGGDLTVDTNTLYVDSTNNRVGIGTTSPNSSYKMTIQSTASEAGIRVQGDNARVAVWENGSSTIGDGPNFYMQNISGGTYAASMQMGAASEILFFQYPNAGAWYERMRIDSAGRVTMPYQPHGAWTQTLSATPSVSILRNNGPVSSVSVSSTGQNGTIGRFTAPVTGLYHFNVTTSQITAGSSNLLVVIYINGTLGGTYLTNAVPPVGEIIDMRSASNIQDGPAYSHAIYLSSSDYVEFSVYRITTGYTDSGNIICSAYLIG